MNSVPSNRKERIRAIKDPNTSQELLHAILRKDFTVEIVRNLIRRDDVSTAILEEILDWSQQAGDSKFGTAWEQSGGHLVGEAKKDYEWYQTRYATLLDFQYRDSLAPELAIRVAEDPRSDTSAAILASKKLLTDEYVIKCLMERPETRQSFYVFLKNPSEQVRKVLIDLAITERNLEWAQIIARRQELTPDELASLNAAFKEGQPESTDEEREEKFKELWDETMNRYRKRLDHFYLGEIVDFISGYEFLDRIFPWVFEALDMHQMDFEQLMENTLEGVRADFYLYQKDLPVDILKAAAKDDYLYPTFCLAGRQNLDKEVAEILLEDEEPLLRFAVARNNTLSRELVLKALEDPHPTVRIGYAQRQNMTAEDLLKILNDPVPAVSQMVFNENHLHRISGRLQKITRGTNSEFLQLLEHIRAENAEQLVRLIKEYEGTETLEAIQFLANAKSGNLRVSLMRRPWTSTFQSALNDQLLLKLAGDPLSQVRKYVVQFKVDNDITQMDYFSKIINPGLTSLQKAVLAAGITDRSEFMQILTIDDDLIKLGCYLNWKATAGELSHIRFSDSSKVEMARQLKSERDELDDFVTKSDYFNYDLLEPRPWIADATSEEQELFWGNQYPKPLEEAEGTVSAE